MVWLWFWFGYGVFFGLNDALVTLSSQAYGAKEYEICGIYLWRARIVYITAFILALPIFLFGDSFLTAIGTNHDTNGYMD